MGVDQIFWIFFNRLILVSTIPIGLILGYFAGPEIGLLVAALFLIPDWFLAKRFSEPIRRLTSQTHQIADHPDLASSSNVRTYFPELLSLEEGLSKVFTKLGDRSKVLKGKEGELETLLASMAEGVLAVDQQSKIQYINESAAEMLATTIKQPNGLSVKEVIRIPELNSFVEETLGKRKPTEKEFQFFPDQERYVQVHGSPLKPKGQKRLGAVFVFNDLTKVRQLEQYRKEFVSNVSHELKTPLTLIQGYAETLIESQPTEQQRQEFLQTIQKHSIRLNSIIEDLLSLSRIERQSEEESIEKESHALLPLVEAAVRVCQVKIEKKDISVSINCDKSIKAPVNYSLVEQALINLLDNAVKYSHAGSKVTVDVELRDRQAYLAVSDQGEGIKSEHLPRLFERFYRVDKSRSRDQGGTGLGLSIVKHIALAHGGEVGVQSQFGTGSKFFILLPLSS